MKSLTKNKISYAATIFYIGSVILTGGLIYSAHSHHRLADTQESLSADIQLLIEAYTFGEKDCYLLAPAPDDHLIWEEMPYKLRTDELPSYKNS